MKVLIQDPDTLCYYQSPGNWTSEPDEGLAFEDSHVAAQYCFEQGFDHAQVILKFEDEQYDVVLPVIKAERASGPGEPHVAMA